MPGSILKFGDGFELDRIAYELRRAGRPQRLERIPMEILLLFVDRRGQLVAREEIIEKVWGKHVFLDKDNGINAAISKIRQVLRDDPENPECIQTVKGKGYRFIATVTVAGTDAGTDAGVPDLPQAAVIELEPEVESQVAAAPVVSTPPTAVASVRKRLRIFLWTLLCIGLIVAVFIATGTYQQSFHRKAVLTEKDTVVLADFANTTGDTVFDGTLRQGLAVQLEQSPFLSLLPDGRIEQTLGQMGKPSDTRLTPEIAAEVCERSGSAAVVDGSISSLGSEYVLGLRAKDCRTGKVFDEQQVQVARKEDLLHALSGMASEFRSRAGESLATVKQHDKLLEDATTPSLEAFRAFSTALTVQNASGSASAIPFLKRAVELDPNFATAYAYLGRLYGDVGELDLSAENAAKAYELRERASDPERFFIVSHYEIAVSGDLEQAAQTCETWAATYPREKGPHGFRGGIIYPVLGKYQEGIEQSKEVIRLDADFPIGYAMLTENYIALDHLKDAEQVLQMASSRGVDSPEFIVLRYELAFLQGDHAEMERQAALGEKMRGANDLILAQQASAFGYSGHLQQAGKMSQQAVVLAEEAGQRERAAQFQVSAAVREALFGEHNAARQSAKAALAMSDGRDVLYGAALALALTGESRVAEAMTNDLEKRFPEDTVVRSSYVPTLRGAFALDRDDTPAAIQALEVASPHELGTPTSSFFGLFGALYPVYVRGNAYLEADQGKEAAEEFQKILDHRGVVLSDPVGALAYLQVGRAYALTGDKDKARQAYGDFLALWKDADPEIPVLKQAKVEYAKLRPLTLNRAPTQR